MNPIGAQVPLVKTWMVTKLFEKWSQKIFLRIDVTTPLPHKNFVPDGVDIALVKFSIVPANNLTSIFVFKILNS